MNYEKAFNLILANSVCAIGSKENFDETWKQVEAIIDKRGLSKETVKYILALSMANHFMATFNEVILHDFEYIENFINDSILSKDAKASVIEKIKNCRIALLHHLDKKEKKETYDRK